MAYENRDYTHLSENEKQRIELIAQAIRNKAYGIDVRESIALAIEWVNREYKLTIENNMLTLKEFENAKAKVSTLELDMDEFVKRYSEQIAGNTSLDETIDARVDATGVSHTTLKDRLDKEQQEVTEKLAQTASDYVNVNSTKVFKYFAHRGITASYPENTIPAIREAARLGFYGVEFDVSETADGDFVLMHDKTVDRTTTGTGITKELTLSQIKAVDIDDDYFPNLKVPTLKEALLVCKQLGLMPLLDITYINFNNESYQGIVNILRETGMEYTAIIQEGFINVLESFRAISDVYLLYAGDVTIADIDTIKGIGRCGASILPALTNYDIPSEVVEYATINDIPILAFTGEYDGWLQYAINKNLVGVIIDNIRRW